MGTERSRTGKERREVRPRAHPKCISHVSFRWLKGMRGKATFPLLFLSLSTLLFLLLGGIWGQGDRGALLGSIISIWDRIWSCKNQLPLLR